MPWTNCVPQDPRGISLCLRRVLRVLRINLWFCVSLVPRELCRTVRCVYRVLQIPGTNRVCVYCASGFWLDIPVFFGCRRPLTPPARSVRYRVCLCGLLSFCVYKPCNLSLRLRIDSSLCSSVFDFVPLVAVVVVALFQRSRSGI